MRVHLRLLPALLALAACGDGPAGVVPPARLAFSASELELGMERSALVELRNVGGQAAGPVELMPGPVLDERGSSVPGVRLATDPAEIATLNPGAGATLALDVSAQGTLLPGSYDASLTARAGDGVQAVLVVRFEIAASGDAEAVSILDGPRSVRTGDVIALPVEVRDAAGTLLSGADVTWEMSPFDAGYVSGSGSFVAYRPGTASLVARVGAAADTAVFEVQERALSGTFSVLGRGTETRHYTSDLWLHGNYAYTGTWSVRGSAQGVFPGNTLLTWDISDPADPRQVFQHTVDARTVNDVKVRADGTLAVITHEGSNDGKNGITLLSLADPASPRIVGRFSTELEPGVHNVWVEGDYVYLVVDGVGSGLRILDISDPSSPTVVGRYYAGSSFLHDVYVRDGLAFLSHWNAGLVVLDVGHGIAGGSPTNPVEVSRLENLGGQTHNAWYWPDAGYVFVGEEDFAEPGIMHVVDVRNLRDPREVATYRVLDQPPHNFWLDEATGVLYLAWYGAGIRAVDVSGDLLGELHRQGREIAATRYSGGPGRCVRPSQTTCTWAPQLHAGRLWVSDMNTGLVALDPPR